MVISVKMLSQNYPISEIPEELKKDANAVIRNSNSQYIINSQNDMEVIEKKVISIINSAGEKYSYVYIPYDRSRRVSDIRIKVYNESGKQIKTYSKSDLNDISQSDDSALYTDDRALYLKISNANYPYTLDIQFTTNTTNTVFLPTLTPFYDYNVSIENRAVEFLNKSGIKLRKKIIENGFAKADISGNDDNLRISYKNITALKEEKYAPSMSVILPKNEFALDQFNLEGQKGNFKSWEEFGKWYNALLEPVSQITPEIQQEVNGLNLQGSKEEKVKKIYQYMQSKTRYVNVAIGIGGWQPMSADNVRKKGYGDCKALTNYMRVLLKAAGIPSYYSIIYMDETSKSFDKDFPKMDGNHVILCVPSEKGDIWLENTSQKIAFNHLDYRTLDRNVMMVKDNTVEINETPKTISDKNKEIIRVKASLAENNNLDVLSKFSYQGSAYDVVMSLLYMTPVEVNDAMRHRYANLQLKNLTVEKLTNDKDNASIDFDFNFKAENYSKSLGSDIFFRAIPFIESDFYLENNERKFPVEIPFGFTDDYEIEYTIPQNYKFSELSLPVKIESEFGNYSLEFLLQDKKLLVKRKFMMKKGIFPPEKVKDYVNFRKQTNKMDNTKILITKL